jgi:uncharacterized membrane-anchored protein YitT (DUF2179 family)
MIIGVTLMAQKRPITFATLRGIVFNYLALTLGAVIAAASVMLFLAPFDIAPSGVSGIAVILNHAIGTPVGWVVLLLNIPIQVMGFYMLPGGWHTVARTIFTVVIFTIGLEYLGRLLPPEGISAEPLLNALFGGVVGGIGTGIIIRAGGNLGGTSTLALIIQRRTGMPLNSIYLYTDTLVLGIAGLIFGWEAALYATVALFIDGTAANYVLEGPSVIRTAVIITNKPAEVSELILHQMGRGVTGWEAVGMYTKQTRHMLYVTIGRSQVQDLRRLIVQADPDAFLVIGQGHMAYGEGFHVTKAHVR